jgi:hypothetical protein
MSWCNTIVLSFTPNEWDEETLRPPKSFKPLKAINKWLSQRDYDALHNMSQTADLGSNAVLFGGCYNYLDVPEFCRFMPDVAAELIRYSRRYGGSGWAVWESALSTAFAKAAGSDEVSELVGKPTRKTRKK